VAVRGISTVLDVTLCLLLIAAAVATLTVPGSQPPESAADETAEQLATATANVTDAVPTDDAKSRLVAGTQAELLGRAALTNLSLDGDPLAPTTAPFRAAVRDRVRRTLAWSSRPTSVTARWAPYPGAPLRGQVVVGPEPPPGVSVGTARLSVPVPLRAGLEVDARDPRSYRAVARSVSVAVIDATLPGAPGAGAGRMTTRERRRRRAIGAALGMREPSTTDRHRNRSRLRRRLTDRLATDVRGRFDSPEAAASALRTGTVEIVVREWSP